MGRTLLGLLATLSGLLLLVGLTFTRAADGDADFRFVNGGEPKTLDPQKMTGQPEGRLCDLVFEGLTRPDARTGKAAPGMAKSWDVSPDGTRYTFHLREDARWTDGHPVTADDFVYGWRRLLAPETASEYSYILFPIRHAEAFSTYDGHAEALEGPIARAIGELVAASPRGLPVADLRRALTRCGAFDPLRSETDPVVTTLLARQGGDVTVDELRAFAARLPESARRLRAEAAAARAHLGVDEGIFSQGPATFVVELRAPTPYFEEVTFFHSAMPAPRWAVEQDPATWFLPPRLVTNGPFRVKTWVVNDHLRLERNEGYWGKDEVKLRSIDALATESDTTALNLYLTGEVDWLPDNYPKDLVDELKGRGDFYQNPALIVYFYRLNVRRPPFDDRRVREAVNLAVDRRAITEQVLGLGQPPAYTFVPPGMAGYESPETGVRFDVARARALLAEAGFPGGAGFPRTGILYNTNGQHKRIAEAVADQLRRNLGVDVSAYNQEWQSYLQVTRSGDYAIARAGWIGDYIDPNTFLDMWTTNSGNNQTGFSSDVYDRLIAAAADVGAFTRQPDTLLAALKDPGKVTALLAAARSATEPAERLRALGRLRLALLAEAEAILVRDEFPIVPLYFYVTSGLLNPRVRGFHAFLDADGQRVPNFKDVHPLRDVSLVGGRAR